MKRILTMVLGLSLSALLNGCASLDSSERERVEVRGDYVAAVDRVARRRGVETIWVNPPTERRARNLEFTTQREVELNRDPGS